jgi:outer membrane cobalamin receptor
LATTRADREQTSARVKRGKNYVIQNALFARKMTLLATVAPMSLVLAMPAFAQNRVAPATATDEQAAAEDTDVIVTGSRIRRPDLESTVPIASIKGADIYIQANPNVGEVLNNLPQLRSTFTQQNPGLGIGIAGLNLLDLRGLGVERTLVLSTAVATCRRIFRTAPLRSISIPSRPT